MSRVDECDDKGRLGLSLNADGPLSGADDQAPVHAIRNGRPEALGILFDRYWRMVFDIARKVLRDGAEAEDLVQDVFLEIYQKAHLYDAARGSVKIWLLQYAYHRSFNRRKYLAVRSFYDASPAVALVHLELVSTRSGREKMSDRDWREVLERGLKELNHNDEFYNVFNHANLETGRRAFVNAYFSNGFIGGMASGVRVHYGGPPRQVVLAARILF